MFVLTISGNDFLFSVAVKSALIYFFVLLGIYFLLKNNYISLVFSGIFLALADLMRPEIIIVLVAAFFV
jgi:hypothetical protein